MIPETEAIFDAELLSTQHPELILEQAREVLMLRSMHALREINTLRAAAETSSSRVLELEEETRRDVLTGIYNRAYLEQFLTREFDNSTRHNWPLSVAFLDLDKFKQLNDSFGHQAGDRVLQATARILRGNTRETDFIARYGGEEFVVVLPATDADTAHRICERIVMAFRNTGPHRWRRQRHRNRVDRLRHAILCKCHSPTRPTSSKRRIRRCIRPRTRGRDRSVPFDKRLAGTLASAG